MLWVFFFAAIFKSKIKRPTEPNLPVLFIWKALLLTLSFINILYVLFMIIFSVLFFIYGLSIKNLFKNIDFDLDMLERIIYKFITAGFAIFTIGGLVFGAVWAETSWGRYWSWDPKETWAFVTWVIYGIYLHGRYSLRWSKEMAASIALIGFLVTIFTYLGVNLLFSGLHSYGSL